ncbi:4373_t:CDS:2 [Diversispora eburnea]|uniref:4373_t:CDS:1 n=1 Tax=Diversispora eburnea TaxID=1213867 RepID=A0A9N8V5N4_9GLOM|nr:4373_t:CDS:2 [Diversispora eburnea]
MLRYHGFDAMQIVGDAIQPFLPLFGTVTNVVDGLYTTYDNAKCNKKICLALIDRVEIVQHAVKSLARKQQENEENFRKQTYYRSWIRFVNVLKTIKKFADEISQQSVFQKFLNANAVKDAFDKNINEFEAVCKDLHFTVAMYSEEQKEQESKQVSEDINILGRVMNDIKEDMKNVLKEINLLSSNVEQLKVQSAKRGATSNVENPLNDQYKVPSIEDYELTDPDGGPDNVRGTKKTVIKKIYRGLEVACKKVQNIEKNQTAESQKIQTELAILNLLGRCPKIILFHGLSEVDQNSVMVLEWASNGNLKELYTKYDIAWPTKLQFIRDIFNGLYFMHRSGILHHDIRCENILITENYDAKISNFEMSRLFQDETTSCSNMNDYVRWLAPEKIRGSRYSHKCEMFSLGMLVWELSNQRIPYEKMNLKEIQDHVLDKKRESLGVLLHPNPIPLEFTKFIKQDIQVSYLIKTLCENHLILGNSPRLTPKQGPNNDIGYFNLNRPSHLRSGSNYSVPSPADFDPENLPDTFDCALDNIPNAIVNIIKPFEDGIKAHKKKDYKEAWECFNEHADLGLSLAKYWKGYYLYTGYYVKKDQKEALKWFKMAADEGVPDAQLRYAFGLLETGNGNSENNEIILQYMTQAADGGNETAMYNLGDIYYNGKLGVEKDVGKGIDLIKLAALKKQPRAIEFLNSNKATYK